MRPWPARLHDGEVTLRPLRYSDQAAWRSARERNVAWLAPWDATAPPGAASRPATFRQLVRRLHGLARDGTAYPFAIEVDGAFAGQVTVNNIVRGSAQFGSLGYWLDREYAGRGVMPRAVAMVIDHCFFTAGPAPDRDRDPAREQQLAAGRREARPARGRASPRSSSTSTAPGATTGSTR